MAAGRFDLVISMRKIQFRDALLKLLNLVGTFLNEEAFHDLVAKTKAQTEEASVDGRHVRKRITQGDQETADAERYAEMAAKGIKPTREGRPDTGERPFGPSGLENVVIDGLLEQLERYYSLFGCRLEQKAIKYNRREAEEANRRGLNVKVGDYMKTEKGGEVFLYKLRFFFFKKETCTVVQTELMKRLKEYANRAIHERAHAYYNDGDLDTLELIPGNVDPSVTHVARVLYDDQGFYSSSIENSLKGKQTPLKERRPILSAPLRSKLGNHAPFGITPPDRTKG